MIKDECVTIPFIFTLQVKLKMQMNEMFEQLTMHSAFPDVACIVSRDT